MRPVFGVDRMPEVYRGDKNNDGSLKTNPMLVYGPGPLEADCGDCEHLFRVGGVAGRYYKCEERRITSGAATDHRVRWPTCAKFEVRT